MNMREQAIADCEAMANECRLLARAFQPAVSEGATIPVPAALCKRLAEVLENCAVAIEGIARSIVVAAP